MRDPFNGVWTIDVNESLVWDDSKKTHVQDEVGEEIVMLRIQDGVQDYEVLYGDRPRIRMGFTARYDDPQWVNYQVREIIPASSDAESELADFKRRIKASDGDRERDFVVGKAYGIVRLISVDERTHYRVSKNPRDGLAQSMMMRRMAPDRNSYVSTVFDVQGISYRIRKFVRTGD